MNTAEYMLVNVLVVTMKSISYDALDSCSGMKYFNETNGCVCTNGLSGSMCDRNGTLCNNDTCKNDTRCSTFISSPTRCTPKEYQFHMLQRYPFSSGHSSHNYTVTMEETIKKAYRNIIRNKTFHNLSVGTRMSNTNIIVEVVVSEKVAEYVYLILIASKGMSSYTYIPQTEICSILSTSDFKCLNQSDCNILQTSGINCPVTFSTAVTPPPKKKVPALTGGVIAIIVALGVIFVILLGGCIFLKIRKRQMKRRRRFNYPSEANTLDPEPVPLPSMFQATTDMSVYNKNNFDSRGTENSVVSDNGFTGAKTGFISDWVSQVECNADNETSQVENTDTGDKISQGICDTDNEILQVKYTDDCDEISQIKRVSDDEASNENCSDVDSGCSHSNSDVFTDTGNDISQESCNADNDILQVNCTGDGDEISQIKRDTDDEASNENCSGHNDGIKQSNGVECTDTSNDITQENTINGICQEKCSDTDDENSQIERDSSDEISQENVSGLDDKISQSSSLACADPDDDINRGKDSTEYDQKEGRNTDDGNGDMDTG